VSVFKLLIKPQVSIQLHRNKRIFVPCLVRYPRCYRLRCFIAMVSTHYSCLYYCSISFRSYLENCQ